MFSIPMMTLDGAKSVIDSDEGDNILGAIYEEDDQGDIEDDVEMVDVDEGKVVDTDARSRLRVLGDAENDAAASKQEPESRNRRRRANKRKNKRKRGSPGTHIDRFVLDTYRRLKEKKSYMVYTAVGCLGVSALSDIVKEVDAIQACGGQLMADGKRQRTGGGVLWSIIKAQEPDAYKKIMKGDGYVSCFNILTDGVYYFFHRAEAIQNASCPSTDTQSAISSWLCRRM